MMTVSLIFFSIIYLAICLYFYIGIYRVKSFQGGKHLRVSVIVAARNEAKNIQLTLESLAQQTYPAELFEVIIVDDRSTDATAEIVQNFVSDHAGFYLLKHQPKTGKATFKKHALRMGIKKSRFEIIMTLDADTRVGPAWIETMVQNYDEKTGLVAGLVTFDPLLENNLFHQLQTLEFAGIVFCGVGAMGNQHPIMCNGANLSYRRRAFDMVGGYDKYLDLPSGDDDLLLQEIHATGHWKVRYCLQKEAVNFSKPVDKISDFFNQRARWASKSTRYPASWVFLLLLSIYIFYLGIITGPFWVIFGLLPIKIYLAALLIKMIPEILILSKGLEYLNRKELLSRFWIGQIFQVPYLLISGLLGILGQFKWKES